MCLRVFFVFFWQAAGNVTDEFVPTQMRPSGVSDLSKLTAARPATATHTATAASRRAQIADLFNGVFARTLSLCLENLENYLFGCHDTVALLLMIRTTAAHRAVMRARIQLLMPPARVVRRCKVFGG